MITRILSFLLFTSVAHGQIFELPYTLHNGWGTFEDPHFMGISLSKLNQGNDSENRQLPIKGLPDGFVTQQISTDAFQSVWQDYTSGKISREKLSGYMNAWELDTLSENLTRKFIRCYVHVAFKKENDSSFLYIVDTNNDLDFSDETIRSAVMYDQNRLNDLYDEHVVSFTYDAFTRGEMQTKQGEILIFEYDNENMDFIRYDYAYSFPHHGKTTLVHDGTEYELTFMFNRGLHLQLEKSIIVQNAADNTYFGSAKMIIFDTTAYRVAGINTRKEVLLLERSDNY